METGPMNVPLVVPPYPALEQRECEYFHLFCDQSLPVPKSLIQERALMTAEQMNSNSFSSYNGWL